MNIFLKAAAGILITVILCIFLSNDRKDFSVILSLFVCCMVIVASLTYFEPVYSFFSKLQAIGNLDPEMIKILLKAVGISLLTEITVLICEDSANAVLGKSLKIMSSAIILWLSIPLFNSLLTLIEEVLAST